MSILIVGLVVFFAVHSVRIVADPLRTATIARPILERASRR